MLIGSVTKQPTETFKIAADFRRRLEIGETVASHTTTSKNLADGLDTTNTLLTQVVADGTRALVRLRAQGTHGQNHRVKMHVVTSLGNTYESEIDVAIRET